MSELIKEIERQLGYDMIEEGNMTAHDVLEIIKNYKQPQLNEDQKVVLERLKDPLNDISNRFAKDYFAYITCLFLGQAPERVIKSYRELSSNQQMQILSAWGLEQEENSDGIN
ncbi:hypothetical protein [Enterococcus spodopteracolus]|uniref:hypothetical protein n=1 Tax=Enterococcus spodopteracolus TaxID=3034501 RepID=UPI0026482152|nr:hypothetical protein [Enterococcus spodopteracolus]